MEQKHGHFSGGGRYVEIPVIADALRCL